MLKALIVDDEQKSRENLKILLEDFCGNVEIVGLASGVDEAIELINSFNPELIFLDIQMNKETGFDLLNRVKRNDFEVIFTTAYSEYAIEAIKFSAIDYLLKPININQLKEAIARVESKLKSPGFSEKLNYLMHNVKVESAENFKLVLPTSDGLIFINYKDVLYCEASSNYTYFHMRDAKKYLVSRTLKEYEDILVNYNFFRIHNSYLVNLREIKKYIKGEGGYVVMANDQSLDVSKRKKETFLAKVSGTKMV